MRKTYLKIARQAIEDVLYERDTIEREVLVARYPELAEEGATFVTLTLAGNLRGCIGSLVAHRPLIDDIISNARSAAFHDPRFMPLTKAELAEVEIEVSLLSRPVWMEYATIEELKRKIRPGVDGVVLSLDGRRATFLPQVWEELPSFELFFSQLCQKAGLRGNCLEEFPQIETYQVEKIKEGEDVY
jgi:hypothetical protein